MTTLERSVPLIIREPRAVNALMGDRNSILILRDCTQQGLQQHHILLLLFVSHAKQTTTVIYTWKRHAFQAYACAAGAARQALHCNSMCSCSEQQSCSHANNYTTS
jgi:hypothetical protein